MRKTIGTWSSACMHGVGVMMLLLALACGGGSDSTGPGTTGGGGGGGGGSTPVATTSVDMSGSRFSPSVAAVVAVPSALATWTLTSDASRPSASGSDSDVEGSPR